MIEQFLISAKNLIKQKAPLTEVSSFISDYSLELSLLLIFSIPLNSFLLYLALKHARDIKKSILNYLEKTPEKFSIKEILLVLGSALTLTLVTYARVIKNFGENIIAIGGDSFNHFARLKESKNLILNADRSYYHWDTIFYPQGLSAFDGDITYYIDFIHLLLSNFFSSELIFNLIMISSYLIGFLGTYLLAKELSSNRITSFLTAYLVTFSSFHFKASGLWLNLVNFQFIPFFFFFFIRSLKTKTRFNLLLSQISLSLVACSSLIFFFFTHIFLGIAGLFVLRPKFIKKYFFQLTGPTIFSLVVISPWVTKMISTPEGVKKHFYYPHINFTLDIWHSLIPTNNQLVSFLNSDGPTEHYYLGISILILLFISILKKHLNKVTVFFLATSFILSLGNFLRVNGNLMPVALPEAIFSFLPFLKSLRATDRYTIFLMFFVGMIIGPFLSSIKNKRLLSLVFFIIFLDYHPFHRPDSFIPKGAPKIYGGLPKNKDAIIELPLNNPIYWYWQSYHQHPVTYGYIWSRGNRNQLLYKLIEKVYRGEKIPLNLLKENKIKHIVFTKNSIEPVQSIPPSIDSTISPFNTDSLLDYFSDADLQSVQLIKVIGEKYLYRIR